MPSKKCLSILSPKARIKLCCVHPAKHPPPLRRQILLHSENYTHIYSFIKIYDWDLSCDGSNSDRRPESLGSCASPSRARLSRVSRTLGRCSKPGSSSDREFSLFSFFFLPLYLCFFFTETRTAATLLDPLPPSGRRTDLRTATRVDAAPADLPTSLPLNADLRSPSRSRPCHSPSPPCRGSSPHLTTRRSQPPTTRRGAAAAANPYLPAAVPSPGDACAADPP